MRSSKSPPRRSVLKNPARILRLPQPGPDYGRALERSARNLLERQAALDRERADAVSLVPQLLAHRPARQRVLLSHDARLHTWGVLEQLLERSRDAVLADSRESERLAGLALAQSDQLSTPYYGRARIEDMRARAWATLAEARRMRSDFAAAARAFGAARLHLCAGTGDSLEWAVLFEAEAELCLCRRQLGDARELLVQAIEIFAENGEDQKFCLVLVTLAAVFREEGEAPQGLALLQEAIRRIDGEQEPRLLLWAQHSLAATLAAAGRLMEARGTLSRARPLYRRFPDGWMQGHLRWLRGRIALGLGQAAEAEAELLGARTGFLTLGARFEAAQVLLELAALYTGQERTAEIKNLAVEAAAAFAACGAVGELREAMVLHRQAEEIEGVHQELARASGAVGE